MTSHTVQTIQYNTKKQKMYKSIVPKYAHTKISESSPAVWLTNIKDKKLRIRDELHILYIKKTKIKWNFIKHSFGSSKDME
jgi:hypothetical protein